MVIAAARLSLRDEGILRIPTGALRPIGGDPRRN